MRRTPPTLRTRLLVRARTPRATCGFVLLTIALGACGGGASTEPVPTRGIVAQSPATLQGVVGRAVATPPAVRVTRNGQPEPNVVVTFAVVSGGGAVAGATPPTDANGIATVGSWTLGTSPGENTVRATVDGASGSPVTFTASAIAGAPASVQPQTPAIQNGFVHRGVTAVPVVLVQDEFGNPVPGVMITFTVQAGDGTVQGGTPSTDASGVARVGAWTLGPLIGEQRLEARLQGAAIAGNPVTFRANAAEFILHPANDTALAGGALRVSRLIVPAGRTVTVTGGLDLLADSELRIDGTVIGTCVPLSLRTPARATVTGTVDNGCAQGDAGAELTLIGGDGYSLNGALIRAGGDTRIAVTPNPGAAARDRSSPRATAHLGSACDLQNTELRPAAERARDGAAGVPTGQPGGQGFLWSVECDGDLRLLGGVTIKGQSGGNGGKGTHIVPGPAVASGGPGGDGGITRLASAAGQIIFSGAENQIETGQGGEGGGAEAIAQGDPVPAKAPGAQAVAAAGGTPGALELDAPGGVVVLDPMAILIGPAGRGGDAFATAADGRDATGTLAAQAGGDATATAGIGGSTPQEIFMPLAGRSAGVRRRGGPQPAPGFVVTGGDLVTMLGGNGGDGGHGVSQGGNGGDGSAAFPHGAGGGGMTPRGGGGGSALVKNLQNVGVGQSGNGGDALARNGNGGHGANRCTPPPPLAGGNGGLGGTVAGHAGSGGAAPGSTPGADGLFTILNAANGGDAGDGTPPGVVGMAGDDSMVPLVATSVNSFADGAPGQPCPGATQGTLIVTVLVSSQPLPGASVLRTGPSSGGGATGADGKVTFANLPAGGYGITAALSGFSCTGTTAVVPAGGSAAATIPCSPVGMVPARSELPGVYSGPGSALVNGCMMSPGGTFTPTILLGGGLNDIIWRSFVDILGGYNAATGGFSGSAMFMSGPVEITESVNGFFDIVNPPRFRGALSFRQRNVNTNAECVTTYLITVVRP